MWPLVSLRAILSRDAGHMASSQVPIPCTQPESAQAFKKQAGPGRIPGRNWFTYVLPGEDGGGCQGK